MQISVSNDVWCTDVEPQATAAERASAAGSYSTFGRRDGSCLHAAGERAAAVDIHACPGRRGSRGELADARSQDHPGAGRPPAVPNEVADRIRREHEDGRTLGEIARALDNDGVPTAQGGLRWW